MINYPTNDHTSFIITDNSSEIARILPDNLVEPLVILAKIKGYKGIDDYVLHLIEHELESIRDGGQGVDDLGEYVIEYIAKIIGPDSSGEEEEEDAQEEDKNKQEVGREET